MSALRVARIPYLNSVPFYQSPCDGFELLDLPPRQLGRVAARGGVDAGIVSLCDLFRDPALEPLGGLGVASDGPAHSVLLFSRVTPDRLSGATISVTGETSTSYPLLRLLLESRYGVRDVAYERSSSPAPQGADAMLLIGDAALRVAAGHGLVPGEVDYAPGLLALAATSDTPWRYALDLAAAWQGWQHMPFVFARWAVRRTVAAGPRSELLDELDASLDASLRDLRPLAAAHAAQAAIDAEAAYAYLMGFTYRFGDREEAAIVRFRELLSGAPWWDERRAERAELGA